MSQWNHYQKKEFGIKDGTYMSETDHMTTYQGQVEDEQYHGFGRFQNKNYIYEGQFKESKRHGKGKIWELASGSIYDGMWRQDYKVG